MVAYSFKKQFIGPILVGLGENPSSLWGQYRPKRQTIRAIGKRRHARVGETIQLYTAMRTSACRKLGEALCWKVSDIRIFFKQEVIRLPEQEIEGAGLDDFARLDGFDGWNEMREFWLEEHGAIVRIGPFVGVLIQWERNDGNL